MPSALSVASATGLRFSVRDEEAAARFNPLVVPGEGPLPTDVQLPAGLEDFRAPLRERNGYRWVEETYRRNRLPLAAVIVVA